MEQDVSQQGQQDVSQQDVSQQGPVPAVAGQQGPVPAVAGQQGPSGHPPWLRDHPVPRASPRASWEEFIAGQYSRYNGLWCLRCGAAVQPGWEKDHFLDLHARQPGHGYPEDQAGD